MERPLESGKMLGPDLTQVTARFGVAAHEQVLAVVDEVAGRFVVERIRPAAEMPALLEQENCLSASTELNCGRQSCDTAADDDTIVCFRRALQRSQVLIVSA